MIDVRLVRSLYPKLYSDARGFYTPRRLPCNSHQEALQNDFLIDIDVMSVVPFAQL